MAYDEILKLKKEKKVAEKTISYVKNLIVGKDIFACSLYKQILNSVSSEKSNNPTNEVLFLSPEKIKNPKEFYWHGPSRVRGENVNLYRKICREEATESSVSEADAVKSIFFKDGKFHPFGSRAKSAQLQFGEPYFKQDALKVDENLGFSTQDLEEIIPKILARSIVKISFNSIEDDLVEPKMWTLELSDGQVISTSNLYWGLPPFLLVDLLESKNTLSREFIEYMQSMRTKAQISVEMQLNPESFEDQEKTWFLPLSQTHEWGHFVGDFYQNTKEVQGNGVENTNFGAKSCARFIHFLDEKEVNEEDVAKKLRILKRNFEKILIKEKQLIADEYVSFEEYSDCQNIDDLKYHQFEKELSHVSFFGTSAPLGSKVLEQESFEDSWFEASHFLRGLLTSRLACSYLG